MDKRILALGRFKEGEMNKTETRYANLLEAQKIAGKILWYGFEPMTLRLAKSTTYKPDFMVMTFDGHLEFHEVKGYWLDDARIKIKVAAEKFPMFRFVAVKKGARGSWDFEEF